MLNLNSTYSQLSFEVYNITLALNLTKKTLKKSNFDLEKIAPSSQKPKRPETRVGLVRVKVDENYGRSGKPFYESMRR